jgi:hypothetical protein
MQRYARANDTQLTRLLTGAVLGLAGLRSPESITVVLECLHVLTNAFTTIKRPLKSRTNHAYFTKCVLSTMTKKECKYTVVIDAKDLPKHQNRSTQLRSTFNLNLYIIHL